MREGQLVVTGGSKGIGAAIVTELARRGRDVVSLSRSGTAPAGRTLTCDLTDHARLREVLAELAAEGPIAGLVNNAGLHLSAPCHELPTEDYAAVMDVNATAVMVACREVHPHLKARGGGMIVNIGSFFDRMGVPHHLAYCASKAAVAAMTRCLAVEWARDGIAVVNVAPGYIETELNADYLARDAVRRWLERRIPAGRVGRPEEVARLVAALLAEDLPFLTGETIYLDGAQGINH